METKLIDYLVIDHSFKHIKMYTRWITVCNLSIFKQSYELPSLHEHIDELVNRSYMLRFVQGQVFKILDPVLYL